MTGQNYTANLYSDFQPVGQLRRRESDRKKLTQSMPKKKKSKNLRDDRLYTATASE